MELACGLYSLTHRLGWPLEDAAGVIGESVQETAAGTLFCCIVGDFFGVVEKLCLLTEIVQETEQHIVISHRDAPAVCIQ